MFKLIFIKLLSGINSGRLKDTETNLVTAGLCSHIKHIKAPPVVLVLFSKASHLQMYQSRGSAETSVTHFTQKFGQLDLTKFYVAD